ncbi:MAG: transketolase [Sedimentisphaerales bacterium]|nr:transketolase [Sedimentisphaerales bacterium]
MVNRNLEEKAKELRRTIFEVICKGGGGHIPACLSIVEILTVLYEKILRINPNNPREHDRDRFILSKGHAGVALYSVLADKGFISREQLYTYGHAGTDLGGHPDMHKVPGVEASTGALGHGLAFGLGMALAGKMDKKEYRVMVLLGDGECQEGTVWEAAMSAPQHLLDNFTVIIDYNKLQALDRLDNIISLEPLAQKWQSFGWQVREVDGHDMNQLLVTFENLPFTPDKPNLVIAHTIKGRGISFMENVPIWHYRLPNEEEMNIACRELGIEKPVLSMT